MIAPELDVEGYLVDPSAWSEDWARETAKRLQVDLTEDHWEALRFMRAFLDERQVAPDARFVMRHLSQTKGAGRNRLFELFPYGYVGQACKLAGMRRPRVWSTG
ncbi:TusE/DsrC/DsvC family sulfur relay protein [Rhodoblastus sp.]|uniref:TusE/DsrC/DsvC family sulfur relay protein n=1 Tax=Rhodoblastus sp. TaxID=1962975 RepID=UPI003F9A7116